MFALALAVVAVIGAQSNDAPSATVDEAVSRLTASYVAKPDSETDRLAERLVNDYAPATDPELRHALELAARTETMFDAHDRMRDEALAILARVTADDERATRVTASLRRTRRESWDTKRSTIVVVPIGFGEHDRPVLYIDGETSVNWIPGDTITVAPTVGVHRAHFRCDGRLCSRTVDLLVTPEDGKTHVIAARALQERVTMRPLTLHYNSTSTLGSRAAGDAAAIVRLLRSELVQPAILVMAEGGRIRLVRIGSEGPLGTLSTLPEAASETARRLLDGDSEAAITHEPAGKPRVLITREANSPPLASLQTTLDAKPTPTAQLCVATPCTVHAPRGRLTMRFSVDPRDEDTQRVVDVTGDVEVTVHPAKRAGVRDAGRYLALGGLATLVVTGITYGIAYGGCKAARSGQPNDGSTSCDIKQSGAGKWFALGGSAALVVGGTMMFTFKPFRVTVKPLGS